jgi:hypothetical protein
MTIESFRLGRVSHPVGRFEAGSSLVRRLVRAREDAAKQRVRAWLRDVDDERLMRFGLTLDDIAVLRGMHTPTSS